MAAENERNDISLCFQALGIEFGAPPEEVEKAYQKMLAEIKKKQASPDPAKRAEAATDLELAHDLYEKIRNSVTYNTRLKEVSHAASIKDQMKKDAVQQFKICPACRKTIGAAFKKCPFCKEPIRTPFEQFMNKLFSGKSIALFVVLLLVIAAVVVATNPGLLKKSAPPPAQEPPASSGFANQTGAAQSSFGNQTGAAQKP